jgi:ribosomal protein L11 methyltransferase
MGSKWLQLSVEAPQEYVEPLSHIFTRYGQGVSVEIVGGFNPDEGEEEPQVGQTAIIRTYLPVDSTTKASQSYIDVGVRLVAKVAPISSLMVRTLDEEEWENAWKKTFFVLHIGKRIVIRPTWRPYYPECDEIIVDLDPGMAFGTGHHPTTRMCLLELERLVIPGKKVLDVGTGSGILAIAAAKLGASEVLAIDIDPIAINVAKQNVTDNGVANIVDLKLGASVFNSVNMGSYELVLANISAKVTIDLAENIVNCIKPGGYLVVSGVIAEKETEVSAILSKTGLTIETINKEDDWIAFTAFKPDY